MPFFWHKDNRKKCISKNNRPSLRDKTPVSTTFIKNVYLRSYPKKRVSSFTSCPFLKASMTLEATLVLPIFMFAVINIISIMDIMRIKGCVDMAVAECGNEIAVESYGGAIDNLLTSIYIREKVSLFLKQNLSDTDYQRVEGSIYVTDVFALDGENRFSFKVNYKIKPAMDMGGLISVKLKADYYGHKWLGYKSKGELEEMVFLSNKASVYHMDKQCKYLNVTIMEIPYINIKVYRNNSGEKYKPCHFCNSRSPGTTVYITPEGDGYHTIQNCIGLTRSIYTVPISRVKGKRVCQGCRK